MSQPFARTMGHQRRLLVLLHLRTGCHAAASERRQSQRAARRISSSSWCNHIAAFCAAGSQRARWLCTDAEKNGENVSQAIAGLPRPALTGQCDFRRHRTMALLDSRSRPLLISNPCRWSRCHGGNSALEHADGAHASLARLCRGAGNPGLKALAYQAVPISALQVQRTLGPAHRPRQRALEAAQGWAHGISGTAAPQIRLRRRRCAESIVAGARRWCSTATRRLWPGARCPAELIDAAGGKIYVRWLFRPVRGGQWSGSAAMSRSSLAATVAVSPVARDGRSMARRAGGARPPLDLSIRSCRVFKVRRTSSL